MDVLTGAGEVVTHAARATDLFDAFPNSYGSLGYATRLRIGSSGCRRTSTCGTCASTTSTLLAKTDRRRSSSAASTTASGSTGSTASSFEPGEAYLTLGHLDATPAPRADG